MEQKITPAIMVVASVLVISALLMASFAVTAFTSDNDSNEYQESESLRLIPTTNNIGEVEEDDKEEDVAITGNALEKASAAALAAVGQGRVTDTEVDDEDGKYEIEITLDNGNEVDIHLDENFNVISKEYEDEGDDEDND